VPADARVTFNGAPTASRSTERVFVTPPLRPDRTYYYDVQAQAERDGRTVTVSRRVPVRAGQVTQETIAFPAPQVAARTP
jgi:uncharacterized protein (TIGR03000 family)